MIRLAPGYVDAIACAYSAIPDRIVERAGGIDFLCGVDPIFVGLHDYIEAADGRSYRDGAHFVWPKHQRRLSRDRRVPTIVLPTLAKANPWIILHEFGHALDRALGSEFSACPVTEYAHTNRAEAFAESFCAWFDSGYCYAGRPLVALDPRADAFFNALRV